MSAATDLALQRALRKLIESVPDGREGVAKAYADALDSHVWDAILEERGRIRQSEHEARQMGRDREEQLRKMVEDSKRLHVEIDMVLAHGPLTMTEEAEKELRLLRTIRTMPDLDAVFTELDKLREVYGVRDSRFRTLLDSVEMIHEGMTEGRASQDDLRKALGQVIASAKGES